MTKNIIKWSIFAGLWAVLLIPFYVANSMFFPYISGKNFVFRIIIEIIFALWVYLAVIDAKYRPKFSWISVSVGIFVLIMAIADIFAVNPMKAIWSNYERMDGFITLLHLIMYLFVFANVMKTEKIWMWFLRSSLITSMFMIIFVIKEWMATGTARVSVTLGNPIYVAVYFMFNLFFALILLYKDVIINSVNSQKQFKAIFSNWLTYVYLFAAAICFFGVWRTSTRGVILGLLGGLIVTSIIISVFEKKNKFIRNSFIGILAFIVIIIVGFFAMKNTSFVKNDITLNRLAQISWNDVAGQGQARQYVWAMALQGVAEKPILGWGQDGFNYVFNKYYDPRMYAQEQWFDRAHNTPLDVLVAGGVLGLLTYLSIFVASLYVIIKKKNNFSATEIGLIIGLLAAYFAQNIFVFDNLISYVYFYVVLAYLYFRDTENSEGDKREASDDFVNYVVAPILVIVFGGMLWYCNVRPMTVNIEIIQAMNTASRDTATSVKYFKNIFEANTFGSTEAREQIVNISPSVAGSNTISEKNKQDFIQLAYNQIQEQVKETPLDARYQFFAGGFLYNLNQFQLALPYLEKAVELSPNKLTMMFELSRCYLYLGQNEKALEVAKKAYDLIPEYRDGKINYVIALRFNNKISLAKQIIGDDLSPTDDAVIRIHLVKAEIFAQNGNKSASINEVQKAMNIAPAFWQEGQQIINRIQNM